MLSKKQVRFHIRWISSLSGRLLSKLQERDIFPHSHQGKGRSRVQIWGMLVYMLHEVRFRWRMWNRVILNNRSVQDQKIRWVGWLRSRKIYTSLDYDQKFSFSDSPSEWLNHKSTYWKLSRLFFYAIWHHNLLQKDVMILFFIDSIFVNTAYFKTYFIFWNIIRLALLSGR